MGSNLRLILMILYLIFSRNFPASSYCQNVKHRHPFRTLFYFSHIENKISICYKIRGEITHDRENNFPLQNPGKTG